MKETNYGYFDYSKLWEYLEKKKLNKSWLRQKGIHSNTIAKLTKNENVNTDVIVRVCEILNCQPKDIMEFKKK